MSRRVCLVGGVGGWHARRLAAVLAARGLRTESIAWNDLAATVEAGRVAVHPEALARADLVVARSMPGSASQQARLEEVIFRMDLLGQVAAAGTPVINPPRSLEVAIDKYLTLARLAAAGLPVPRTRVAQTAAAAERLRNELGAACVLKPLFGSGGKGLIRLEPGESISAGQVPGSVMYLQEFISHPGWDARVLVVGERLFAIRRQAAAGEWRTNLALGGQAEPFELPAEWGNLARRVATAVGGSLVGVDLLPAEDGRVFVLEANAVPAWRGVEAALGEQVSEAIADHLAGQVGR
ncbi:MAG: RimK family alpha-L-glutamate ligase [Planctomycetota bacterium]|jgi:RimK family alpha-L-glutamate ligase|nr:RimK family alpha-L-glutamate ligase [Planctomycetota bacterium]